MKSELIYPAAGMLQATQLSIQLASLGYCDTALLDSQLNSLFVFNPTKTIEIYGNNELNLHLGLIYLKKILLNPWKQWNRPIRSIVDSFFKVAKYILQSTPVQKKLLSQLEKIKEQINYFGSIDHPLIFNNLADIYVELSAQLNLNLKIFGQQKFLQNQEILNKIRVCLLMGIRSAVIWKQLGGQFFSLFLYREHISHKINHLFKNK